MRRAEDRRTGSVWPPGNLRPQGVGSLEAPAETVVAARFLPREPRAAYQTPVFCIEAQGSWDGNEPFFWMSSIEMSSGVRMKAM